METEGMRTQLTSLARQLNSVVQLIAPASKSSKSFVGTQAERKAFFAKVCNTTLVVWRPFSFEMRAD